MQRLKWVFKILPEEVRMQGLRVDKLGALGGPSVINSCWNLRPEAVRRLTV